MKNDYFEKIDLIHNLLINSNVIRNKVEEINLNEKHILDIGSILYKNGKKIGDYTLFPYDIYIKKGTMDNVSFKIAITYGAEENSINYCSNYPKEPIKIKKGVVLIGNGKYLYNKKIIELNKNDIDLMVWNTKFDLQTLKDKVGYWGHQLSSKEYWNIIGDKKNNMYKDKIYIDNNIYLELHHIDNNSNNNILENLLYVTIEQHASIHLFMWENYILEENMLKRKRTSHNRW